MDIKIKDQEFIVCGATSGFGLAVTKHLVGEGAKVIAVARTEEKLKELQDAYSSSVETLQGDITKSATIKTLSKLTEKRTISGILVNAGGPPAMKFVETALSDWDDAYQNLLRWKVELTHTFLPRFLKQGYGRFLYIESSAVKQPIDNLVLSTSLRLSVVGFVKTLSQEIPNQGVTFNVIAPGFHQTPAVDRLIDKKAKDENISKKQAQKILENNIPVGKAGDADNFGSLATWLLSPLSEFVTGQVYALDGGVLKGTL